MATLVVFESDEDIEEGKDLEIGAVIYKVGKEPYRVLLDNDHALNTFDMQDEIDNNFGFYDLEDEED